MIKIALLNEKGGVGKTTLAYNLGAGLALKGYRVLFIDADAQANLTTQCGIKPKSGLFNVVIQHDDEQGEWGKNVFNVPPFAWRVGHADVGTLSILPGNLTTRTIPIATDDVFILKNRLEEIQDHFDYCIFDTAPSPSLTHAMIYNATDAIIIPTEPTANSIQGVANTMSRITQINTIRQNNLAPLLKMLGLIINKIEPNTNAHHTGIDILKTNLPNSILPRIHKRTIWQAAEYAKQTIFTYNPLQSESVEIARAEMWEIVNAVQSVNEGNHG
jgi:chromosome partitioning protein